MAALELLEPLQGTGDAQGHGRPWQDETFSQPWTGGPASALLVELKEAMEGLAVLAMGQARNLSRAHAEPDQRLKTAVGYRSKQPWAKSRSRLCRAVQWITHSASIFLWTCPALGARDVTWQVLLI